MKLFIISLLCLASIAMSGPQEIQISGGQSGEGTLLDWVESGTSLVEDQGASSSGCTLLDLVDGFGVSASIRIQK
jgi:hypothetical protein